MEAVTTRVSAENLLQLFEQRFALLWRRARQTLCDDTLIAVVDRVLYVSAKLHPLASELRVDATGLRCQALTEHAATLHHDQLAEAIRFVLVEFLVVLGSLTAEILSSPLHLELSSAAMPSVSREKACEVTHPALVAEIKRAQRRLQQLPNIGKLLLRFETIELIAPQVIALVATTLPLRSAILILQTNGITQTFTWQPQGESSERLRVADAHAHVAYSYFVDCDPAIAHTNTHSTDIGPPTATTHDAVTNQSFVMFPFVFNHGSIFGALQIEGAEKLNELDLSFVNAVANQLAIGLGRFPVDRALRVSEAKLAGIVAIAADALISIDETQHIVMYNEGAEKIFGWSRDEVLGKPLDILIPARFREVHREHIPGFASMPETARKMGIRRSAIFGLRKSGREFPADAAISKLDVEGAWLFTIILRDITEQKRAEHEEEFLAEMGIILASTLDSQETLRNIARLVMVEFADFCIIEFVDEQGVLSRMEVAISNPDKKEIAEALKQFPYDRSKPHLSSSILQSKQPFLMTEVSDDSILAISQSDEYQRLLQAFAPRSMMGVPLIIDGRLLGTLVVASCDTERRYSAAHLRLLIKVGGHAVLALENARLYRVGQRAIQTRDEILGIVAHDLRNPLNTVLMQTALLKHRGLIPDHRSQNAAKAIERAVGRMTRLVQDLLDVTAMESGHLSIEPARISSSQLIFDSVEAQKTVVSSSSMQLVHNVATELPEIWADRDRLLQVFENLIGNATKFTAAGGQITVGARPSDDEVIFFIKDTGSGISVEDLPHVFDRFWKVQKTERKGAGLGLAIVKVIVEAHGGRVWVESTIGEGSTFNFTLPVAP